MTSEAAAAPTPARRIPAFFLCLFACEAFFGLMHVAIGMLPSMPETLAQLFHIGLEANVPAWFSSLQLALVGLLLLAFFLHERSRGTMAWGLLMGAGAFLFLSMDEAAQVHEFVSGVIHKRVLDTEIQDTAFRKTGYWMFILPPFLIAGLWICWRMMRPYLSGQPARRKLIGGFVLFLACATVPEILFNFVKDPWKLLEQVVEEVGEMAGITIILWGVLQLLAAHDVRLEFRRLLLPGG